MEKRAKASKGKRMKEKLYNNDRFHITINFLIGFLLCCSDFHFTPT